MLRPLLSLAHLLVAACSASGTEPRPAVPATPAKAVTPATPAKAESPLAARGLVPPPPSEAMVQQILAQGVLDHPRVAPYLHTEDSANVPLAVFPSPDLAKGAEQLRAAGQGVRVVATEAEARVIFRGRERVGPAKERVKFEIPAEGVAGHVDLQLAEHEWSAVDAQVVER